MVSENKYRDSFGREARDAAELAALRAELMPKQEEVKEPEPAPTSPVDDKEKTFEKRYGDLRRHLQQKEDSYKKEISELKSKLKETKKEFPTTDDDLAEWAANYPDIYNRIVTIAMKESSKSTEQLDEKLKAIEEREKLLTKREAFKRLLEFHPDFNEIVSKPDFKDWVETQPQYIYDSLYVNETNAVAAARAIDLYKLDNGIYSTKKSATRPDDAARSVRTPPSDAPTEKKLKFTESMVAKMKQADYEKHKAEIYEAMQSKDFYDLEAART